MAVDLAPVDSAEQREREVAPKATEAKDPFPSLLEFAEKRTKAYQDIFGTPEEMKAKIQGAEQKAATAEATSEGVWKDVMVPALVDVIKAARIPVPKPQELLPQPVVPDTTARPFMDVSEKNALGAVVSTLGMMAQMAMAGKAPVAALGAVTGAMEGWHAGDKERGDRQWKTFLAETERINRTNRDNLALFDAAMVRHTTNLQAAQAEVIASMYAHGHYDAAARVARDGVVQAFNQAYDLQNHTDKMWGDIIKIIEAQTTRDLKLEMERNRLTLQDAWHREMARSREEDRKSREAIARQNFNEKVREFEVKRSDKAAADGGGQGFTPEALELASQQYYTTGNLPPLGMGKASTDARVKIMNRAGELASTAGTTGADFVARTQFAKGSQAELSKLQVQRGQIMAFAHTADQNLNAANALAKKVDAQGVPVINRWILAGRKRIEGDPDVTQFHIYTDRAVAEIARITSSATGGGVSSDSARREANELLQIAYTPEQFDAAVTALKKEVDFRREGFEKQIKAVEDNVRRLLPQQSGTPLPGGGPKQTPPRPGMIRVRRKSDGEPGWLDRKDLGSDLYEVIEGQ
jgi:hypothetical protein